MGLILVIVIITVITLKRLEKKIIELNNNNVCDTYKKIDEYVDTIKSANVTINGTIELIKNINECIANNHNEIKDKLHLNYEHISDISIQLDKLSAQINKRNTKLITAKNSSRPHKVAKPVAHPKHNN